MRVFIVQVHCCELEFFAELFWVVDSPSVDKDGLSHVFGEVFWLEFFEFFPFGYDDAAVSVFQAFNS